MLKPLLLIFVLIAASQLEVFASGGFVGAPVERRQERRPSEEEIRRRYQIDGMVLSSTPLDENRKFKGPATVSVVKSHFDDSGFLYDLRLDQASEWLDQDFWTLWATASFPPVKPYSGYRVLEPTLIICNSPGKARDCTAEESSIRDSLAKALPQEDNPKAVTFTLIPASFIEVFPDEIKLGDVCNKDNFVRISLDVLQRSRNGCWTKYSAVEVLKSTNSVSELLEEWPAFFRENLNPSRAIILAFAAHLKEKYKVLFVQ